MARRWITSEIADQAGLRRVSDSDGRFMFRRRVDSAGIIIPNFDPWESDKIRDYRIRLDNPPREPQVDGTFKVTQKYLQPPEAHNLLYVPRGATARAGADVPVIITEGEFKALALWRLANHESEKPRFLPVAVAGVWCWKGRVGKTNDARGRRVDERGVIPDVESLQWDGRRVIIAYDADIAEKRQVSSARWALTQYLTERGAQVGFLEWPPDEGKGIDDRLANIGPERVLADIAAVEFGDWRARIIRGDYGEPRPCLENIRLVLEHHFDWKGVLGYDEFAACHTIMRTPPDLVNLRVGDELQDHFDTELTQWLERQHIMVRPDQVRLVVDAVARKNAFHPVRDYLSALPEWDGVARIGTWLIDYCGVESSDTKPNCYAMAVGAKFLISAVARVMQPGCKVDCMLVMEGTQGIGKSTAAQILAGEAWFTDHLSDLGSKDFSMQVRGIWIAEMAELDVLGRVDQSRAKGVISQQVERFRPPYGHRIVRVPRQCVFIGTGNKADWLRDETGGRRFWPVKCRPVVGQMIDTASLRRDRDQIWAEALRQYRAGATWWLDDAETVQDAIEEQKARYQTDPWQEPIEVWIGGRQSVSIAEILSDCLLKPKERWTQLDKNRLASCMTSLGWERYQRRGGDHREWRYRRCG